MKRSFANLPLHGGKAPRWLFARMQKMAGAVAETICEEFGPHLSVSFRQEHEALDLVLQFPHVPGPRIGQHQFPGLFAEALCFPVQLRGALPQKEIGEGQNILLPFPERRNRYGKHIDPESPERV